MTYNFLRLETAKLGLTEERLGRSPLPSEIVHHDDENRQNNNPSNLIVMTRAEHSRLHRIRQRKGRKNQNQLTLNLNTQGHYNVCQSR
jgi:hypothetical protein